METTVLLIALVCGVAVGLYFALRARWRGNDNEPLLLGEMLSRTGADVRRLASEAAALDRSLAAYRCLGCQRSVECRRWLGSGARDGYQAFCPNAAFIDSVKR